MKVKLNSYVCEQFGNKSLFFEDGVIYNRDQNSKMKELPNQKRSLTKLAKALKSYSDDTDFELKAPEKNVLKQLNRSTKRSNIMKKRSKTKKWFI